MTQIELEQVERDHENRPRESVILPIKLYLAMANCYFGGGPRFREEPKLAHPSINKVPGPVQELPPSEEEVGKLPSITQPVMISRPLPGRPMGAAATELSPPRK